MLPGRTISRVIAACGLDQQGGSADYRVFSRSPWHQRHLFSPLIEEGVDYFSGRDHITLAGDFTHLPKTGRYIPNVHCMRDPMSPAFHVNLIYGLRFVQHTMLLPLYEGQRAGRGSRAGASPQIGAGLLRGGSRAQEAGTQG